ncbi:unnamed protein product [Oikopleura dioica]|uniref:Uncharacterized protein n=1 Tax=Oikopleura dioica TaxID=34765 RepID=E4YZ38_OIKDI|nr:unnamed protein product [Oikopleura dioica]
MDSSDDFSIESYSDDDFSEPPRCNQSDESSIDSNEDDFFAEDSPIVPGREFESKKEEEKDVPGCPVIFDKVIDSKWQNDKRRKGINRIGDIPVVAKNAKELESVDEFEPEVQQIKQREQMYGGAKDVLMKLFTPEKGKIYQFCHLSSCEASLTAMKICLDTIMRSCVEGVDSHVLFVDPKEKLSAETTEEFAEDLIWMQDLSMPGDTDVFLENFLHYECRNEKDEFRDEYVFDNDDKVNDEDEPTSKLDNFLTMLLSLEKECPFRLVVFDDITYFVRGKRLSWKNKHTFFAIFQRVIGKLRKLKKTVIYIRPLAYKFGAGPIHYRPHYSGLWKGVYDENYFFGRRNHKLIKIQQ